MDTNLNKHNIRLILIAICSGLTGLLFGYDAGIIASAIIFIKKTFNVDPAEIGWIVAMVPLGALLTAMISGYISDFAGRKKALFGTAIFFIAGTFMSAFAGSVMTLMIGRLLLGLAIGLGSSISPIYTAELAADNKRGWLVNMFVTSLQGGVFLSYVTGYFFSNSGDWRLMLLIGIIPAGILGVGAIFLPESPRWLAMKGKTDKALKVLTQIYNKTEATKIVKEVTRTVSRETKDAINWRTLFDKPKFLKVLFIAVAVAFFTQTVGINAFLYYGPTIYEHAGLSATRATLLAIPMGFTLFIATVASLFFIDKIGRKKPLMLGTAGILILLIAITIGFHLFNAPMIISVYFFICALLFMVCHGLSIGPACFLIPSEVFPGKIRGLGMGTAVAVIWGVNVLVSAYTPVIIAKYGPASLFAGFFILTAIGFIIFWRFVPETKDVSLETIENNVLDNLPCRKLGQQ